MTDSFEWRGAYSKGGGGLLEGLRYGEISQFDWPNETNQADLGLGSVQLVAVGVDLRQDHVAIQQAEAALKIRQDVPKENSDVQLTRSDYGSRLPQQRFRGRH